MVHRSAKVICLDFFPKLKGKIQKILETPPITQYCEPIIDLTLIFSDIGTTEAVTTYLSDESQLPQGEIDNIGRFFANPFQTSFSYGYKEREFIFIRLEKSSPLLAAANRDAFVGLLLHEIIHSVQRQRGLEVRLKNSLVFSMEFFTQLASIFPDAFEQEEIITFLKEISQFALYSLKDIYANVELMKRGLGESLIRFYSIELGFGTSLEISTEFDTPFEKGQISIKNLASFAQAFNFMLSLIPSWLPMIIETSSMIYEQSRLLKHFIFEKYYGQLSLITRELWSIEDLFLTTFSFSRSFHQKWFGAIFNLALEYILGENFIFYYLAKATELVGEIYGENGDSERRRLAMVPILKAAYVQAKEYPAGIQQKNIDELMGVLADYTIDQDEITELEELVAEARTENGHFSHFFEDLIQLSIMILARDFRKTIVQGDHEQEKLFARVILALLQAISYLEDECDDKYYHLVRRTVKCVLRYENDVFAVKKHAMLLETVTKNAVSTSVLNPRPEEVEELLFNLDFFEVPLINTTLELGVSFIYNIKVVMNKVPIDDPEFPLLVAQFISVLLKDRDLSPEDLDQLNMILVSSLVATSGVPFAKIQPVLEEFVAMGLLASDSEENTEINA